MPAQGWQSAPSAHRPLSGNVRNPTEPVPKNKGAGPSTRPRPKSKLVRLADYAPYRTAALGSLYSTPLVPQKTVAMSSQAATRFSAFAMLTVCLH